MHFFIERNELAKMINVMVVLFLEKQVNNLRELISNKFHYGNNFAAPVVRINFENNLLELIFSL